ncbi:MAG: hypothetical protein PWP59_1558, partial [Sphaerochaeta sp.]|nr:hypothetical protein [Sphaerochaeta sp.]
GDRQVELPCGDEGSGEPGGNQGGETFPAHDEQSREADGEPSPELERCWVRSG